MGEPIVQGTWALTRGNPPCLLNNDTNYRVKAGAAIRAGAAVYIDSNGLAQEAQSDNTSEVWGICPQDVPSGEVVPVMRSGKVDVNKLPLAEGYVPTVGHDLYLDNAGKFKNTASAVTGEFKLPLLKIIAAVGSTTGEVGALIRTANLT